MINVQINEQCFQSSDDFPLHGGHPGHPQRHGNVSEEPPPRPDQCAGPPHLLLGLRLPRLHHGQRVLHHLHHHREIHRGLLPPHISGGTRDLNGLKPREKYKELFKARVVTKGQKKILCSYLAPVLVMAVILNIPKMVSLAKLLFSQVKEFKHINSQSREMKHFQENMVGMELYLQINILYQVFHPLVTCCIFPLVTLTVLNLKIAKGKTVCSLMRLISIVTKLDYHK